jgi:hypothetical protein
VTEVDYLAHALGGCRTGGALDGYRLGYVDFHVVHRRPAAVGIVDLLAGRVISAALVVVAVVLMASNPSFRPHYRYMFVSDFYTATGIGILVSALLLVSNTSCSTSFVVIDIDPVIHDRGYSSGSHFPIE